MIADVAVSVVPKKQSGMAAAINDTFLQVGVAVGIALWGAILANRGADKIAELTAGLLSRDLDSIQWLAQPLPAGGGFARHTSYSGSGSRCSGVTPTALRTCWTNSAFAFV